MRIRRKANAGAARKGHLTGRIRGHGFEWGGVFAMNPEQKYLSEAEYAEMIGKIRDCLE